ncbi:hypothetical protein [Nocardia abscessus]|uniref:hypothetical protein n=1 Tax=Nocardia abscessus TaxID=120957 RepID=UPI0002DB7407|nr:hypothetical protein [Nocardia abscessus]MCC3333562.1 hypothetical protein [Nocardia abscessus]
MTPAEWIAEQTARLNMLETWRGEENYPGDREVLEAEIEETRRVRDDFIEFAAHTYRLDGETR